MLHCHLKCVTWVLTREWALAQGTTIHAVAVYTKTTGSPYTYNTFLCQRAVCMAPMGVDDMHTMHMGSKIVLIYVQLYLLV